MIIFTIICLLAAILLLVISGVSALLIEPIVAILLIIGIYKLIKLATGSKGGA